MDQSFAESANLHLIRSNGHWEFHYPSLQNSGGITSSLIAGLYKLIIPTSHSTLNWHIRILAMVGYLGSGFLLFQRLASKISTRLLCLALLASSGFQFLQPSSELFAASSLSLFVFGAMGQWPVWLASGLLVCYGLCKVELTLSAIGLVIFWWIWEWKDERKRWLIPASASLWAALFVLPAIVINGKNGVVGSRSWEAFKVKYTSLFHPHQIQPPGSDPWGYSHKTIDKIFPKSEHSVFKLIIRYPRMYIDYLALSIVQSSINILSTIKFLIIPIGIYLKRRWPLPLKLRFSAICLLIVIVLGLGPGLFLGFIHSRYVMRYFALILAVLIPANLENAPKNGWLTPLVWTCCLLTLILEFICLPTIYAESHFL